jgi:hypothetical protein
MSGLKSYVEVELGGENKLLKFDYNAVADIEEKFGKGIVAVFKEENVGFNTVRLFYWAGLKWKDPGLTVQRVGGLLGDKLAAGGNIGELMEPIVKALKASRLLGDMERGEGEDEGKN